MFKLIFILSIIAYVSSASVKREEFNTDPLLALTSQVTGNRESPSVSSNNNSPVYNPSNSNGGYSSYSSNFANSAIVNTGQNTGNLVSNNPSNLNYGNQPDSTSNQAFVDNIASAASNLPSTSQNQNQPEFTNNQGNLYYYYYPVQDKNKEISYQASPSNQYPSTIVQPQNAEDNSGSSATNLSNNQQTIQGSNTPGHDLSYSGAQDLAYTASALNENGNAPNVNLSPSRNNYESQLSSLASALNQYGFNPSSSNNAFSAQFANQLSGFNNLGQNYGESYSGSIPQPSSVPFVNDPFTAAMASQLNGFQSGQPIQNANTGSSNGGPLSQLYQQATQVYQGLINGATGGSSSQPQFAASQQHASYEPSTANSLRSKYGLGTIIMPMLALAGLSLLIPTVTSLSTVASRKKRSSEGSLQNANLSPYFERIERYYSLYKNAVEKEECMNRIICELGDAVSNVRGKDALFGFVERMVPNGWMGSKVSVFKSGALSIDNAKCIKYKCH